MVFFFGYKGGFLGGSVVNNMPANAGDMGQEDPLKKEMATYSSILAWEIPWAEEPGGLLLLLLLSRLSHVRLCATP